MMANVPVSAMNPTTITPMKTSRAHKLAIFHGCTNHAPKAPDDFSSTTNHPAPTATVRRKAPMLAIGLNPFHPNTSITEAAIITT